MRAELLSNMQAELLSHARAVLIYLAALSWTHTFLPTLGGPTRRSIPEMMVHKFGGPYLVFVLLYTSALTVFCFWWFRVAQSKAARVERHTSTFHMILAACLDTSAKSTSVDLRMGVDDRAARSAAHKEPCGGDHDVAHHNCHQRGRYHRWAAQSGPALWRPAPRADGAPQVGDLHRVMDDCGRVGGRPHGVCGLHWCFAARCDMDGGHSNARSALGAYPSHIGPSCTAPSSSANPSLMRIEPLTSEKELTCRRPSTGMDLAHRLLSERCRGDRFRGLRGLTRRRLDSGPRRAAGPSRGFGEHPRPWPDLQQLIRASAGLAALAGAWIGCVAVQSASSALWMTNAWPQGGVLAVVANVFYAAVLSAASVWVVAFASPHVRGETPSSQPESQAGLEPAPPPYRSLSVASPSPSCAGEERRCERVGGRRGSAHWRSAGLAGKRLHGDQARRQCGTLEAFGSYSTWIWPALDPGETAALAVASGWAWDHVLLAGLLPPLTSTHLVVRTLAAIFVTACVVFGTLALDELTLYPQPPQERLQTQGACHAGYQPPQAFHEPFHLSSCGSCSRVDSKRNGAD